MRNIPVEVTGQRCHPHVRPHRSPDQQVSDPSRAGARSLAFRPSHRSQFPTKRSVIATTDSPAHEAFMAPASAHPQRYKSARRRPSSSHGAPLCDPAAHALIVQSRGDSTWSNSGNSETNPVPNVANNRPFSSDVVRPRVSAQPQDSRSTRLSPRALRGRLPSPTPTAGGACPSA